MIVLETLFRCQKVDQSITVLLWINKVNNCGCSDKKEIHPHFLLVYFGRLGKTNKSWTVSWSCPK